MWEKLHNKYRELILIKRFQNETVRYEIQFKARRVRAGVFMKFSWSGVNFSAVVLYLITRLAFYSHFPAPASGKNSMTYLECRRSSALLINTTILHESLLQRTDDGDGTSDAKLPNLSACSDEGGRQQRLNIWRLLSLCGPTQTLRASLRASQRISKKQ